MINENLVSGHHPFAIELRNSIRDHNQLEKEWTKKLKYDGIKAAHPDDGWVDRKINKVFLCYPQFNHNPKVGELIALGNHEKYRIVKVIEIETSMFGMVYYKFEEVL